jgi:hypothetical protein
MVNVLVLLAGVFGIPILLLWGGHRLRRRSARWRSAFLGALLGYAAAAVLSLWASMDPAAMWGSGDTLRGLLGYWSLLIGPAVGALLGVLLNRTHSPSLDRRTLRV